MNTENLDIDYLVNNDFLYEVSNARSFKNSNPNYYSFLHYRIRNYCKSYFRPVDIVNIQYLKSSLLYIQDIDRTIPAHRDQEEKKQIEKSLTNILYAYSIRNPIVHYCQGFNFIANFLIQKKFDEEEAFWIFTSILETAMPLDYYQNMVSVIIDATILKEYIAIFIPDLSAYFTKLNIEPLLFLVQWFVCMFVSNVQQHIATLIWILLCVDGFRALFKTSIVLLHHYKEEIMKAQDFPTCLKIIESLISKFDDPKTFLTFYQQIYISKKALKISREILRKQQLEQYKSRIDKTLHFKFPFPDCHKDQPVCNHTIHLYRTLKRTFSFSVLQAEEPIRLDRKYLEKSSGFDSTNLANTNDPLIGRGYHECEAVKQMEKELKNEDQFIIDLRMKEYLEDKPYFVGISFYGVLEENLLDNNQILRSLEKNEQRKRKTAVFNIAQLRVQDEERSDDNKCKCTSIIIKFSVSQSESDPDDYLEEEEVKKQSIDKTKAIKRQSVLQLQRQATQRRQGITYKNQQQGILNLLDNLMSKVEGSDSVTINFAREFLQKFN